MTGMSFFGLFVIILILISFSIIIAEELRRKEEKREHTKMENITIMVVGVGINDTRNSINNISFYKYIR